MRQLSSVVLALSCALVFGACKAKETFPDIGTDVVSPIDVAVSDAGNHFFVLNADFDRTYNKGSLLVIDKDGNKVTAVETPRMGRSLTVAGNDLLVTFDYGDDAEDPMAQLYDVTDPANPQLKAEWALDCSPFNAVLRKGYPYFAMSCLDGSLWVGELAGDRAASTFKKVRRHSVTHRALYIDPARNLLFAFTADPKAKVLADTERQDVTRYDAAATEQPGGANEVPDEMEKTKRAISNKGQRQIYQFVLYDLAGEKENAPGCTVTEDEDCRFPYRPMTDAIALNEMRWLYFRLYNFDGTPDQSTYSGDPTYKYYRTNFYEARPDPQDANVFYLSHRGPPDKGPYANQIVRVTLMDEPVVNHNKDLGQPPTAQFMSFERVYGFKGQGQTPEGEDNFKYHYPSDFEVGVVDGQKVVVVNHFRDLVNWSRGDTYFSLGAQVLDDYTWFSELEGSLSSSDITTYYQVAMNPQGVIASCSFYGNAVVLLKVLPGVGLQVLHRVE